MSYTDKLRKYDLDKMMAVYEGISKVLQQSQKLLNNGNPREKTKAAGMIDAIKTINDEMAKIKLPTGSE